MVVLLEVYNECDVCKDEDWRGNGSGRNFYAPTADEFEFVVRLIVPVFLSPNGLVDFPRAVFISELCRKGSYPLWASMAIL